MIRELDSNKRQTELLTKRLEETKIEKEKILANQEQNKLDQKANEEAIIQQMQKFEAAKKKVN
jgi:glutamate synthase domain-containing protein 3